MNPEKRRGMEEAARICENDVSEDWQKAMKDVAAGFFGESFVPGERKNTVPRYFAHLRAERIRAAAAALPDEPQGSAVAEVAQIWIEHGAAKMAAPLYKLALRHAEELDCLRQRNKEHEMFRHQHRECDAMGVELQQVRQRNARLVEALEYYSKAREIYKMTGVWQLAEEALANAGEE